MGIVTQKFVRKPLFVDAVQVTAENFMEIAFWCGGSIKSNDENADAKAPVEIDPSNQHIKVQVENPKNLRQTKAVLTDWILYTDKGFKVYTDRAFQGSFDPATGEQMDQQHQQEKTQPDPIDEPQAEEAQSVADAAQEQVDEVKDDLATPEHQPEGQKGSETVTEDAEPSEPQA